MTKGSWDEEGGFAQEAPSLLSLSVTHPPGCPRAWPHQVPMARPLGVGLGPSACSWVLEWGVGCQEPLVGLAHTHHCPAGRSDAPSRPLSTWTSPGWGDSDGGRTVLAPPSPYPSAPGRGGGSRPAEGWEGGPGPCRPWQGGFLPALIGGTWLSAAGSECQRSDFVAGL